MVAVTFILVFFWVALLYLLFPSEDTLYVVSTGVLAGLLCTLVIIFCARKKAAQIFLDKVDAVEPAENALPVLRNVVEEMSISASLGYVPKIYLIRSFIPNAFAVGINKKNAAIAVTTGLLTVLDRDELQGVVAHEISHIKNQDTLYLLYAGLILGFFAGVQQILYFSCRSSSRSRGGNSGTVVALLVAFLFAIVSAILVRILYFTLSRKREFLADACACRYTRYPVGLAKALRKISSYNCSQKPDFENQEEKVQTDNLVSCMYIHNFLQAGKNGFFDRIFSTHPPIEDRIKVLTKMGAADFEEYNKAYSAVVSPKKALIPKKKMLKEDAAPLAIIVPGVSDSEKYSRISRQRETKDSLNQAKGYKIINCECKTILKIPPEYTRDEIVCPHCKTVHKILV